LETSIVIGLWLLSHAVAFFADSPAGTRVPLLASCSDPTEVVASIETSAPLQIRYSMAGESEPCYAVTVTMDGKSIKG
jgi:hypothetical protein